jgi:hypothetical protein
MTAAACSKRFSSLGRRSMRAARSACTLGGIRMAEIGCARRYAPGAPTRTFVSTRVRTLSSRNSGFPSVRCTSRRSRLGAGPQQGTEEFLGPRGAQRIDPDLRVVGLASSPSHRRPPTRGSRFSFYVSPSPSRPTLALASGVLCGDGFWRERRGETGKAEDLLEVEQLQDDPSIELVGGAGRRGWTEVEVVAQLH